MNYYEKGVDEEFDKECEQRTIASKIISRLTNDCAFHELPCVIIDFSGLIISIGGYLFSNCPQLRFVNLSRIAYNIKSDYAHLFRNCPRVEYVKLSNIKFNSITNSWDTFHTTTIDEGYRNSLSPTIILDIVEDEFNTLQLIKEGLNNDGKKQKRNSYRSSMGVSKSFR